MALKTVIIPPEAEGMKTGLFLRRLFPDLPESAVRKLFDARRGCDDRGKSKA